MLVQRRLVLLAGGHDWAGRVTSEIIGTWKQKQPELRILRADVRDPPVRAWMGQELDAVVLTAHRRRFLDTFGAVSGALRGGGVLLFQVPPMDLWRQERLGARWCRLLEDLNRTDLVVMCREGRSVPPAVLTPPQVREGKFRVAPNQEQRELLDAILRIKASRPLLIFGRRGRGKSAALGMAAAVLLQRTGGSILVTSPSKAATSQAFWAAEQFLPEARRVGTHKLRFGKYGTMEFVEPKLLQRRNLKESFLIVDEAAGFPVSFLGDLLHSAGRVLLATTLDGYEGSGNGFLVRGVPRLRRAKSGLQLRELRSSWRWTEGCPLEALSRAALLLDAAPVAVDAGEVGEITRCAAVEEVERSAFANAETQLKELYGLLRVGHYKTKPSDLETFLDAAGIIWLGLRHHHKFVGITISGIEEPVHGERAQLLWLARCQVPQNLTAQTLARDAGVLEASELRYARMMRWCLHPALRGCGLGERLLSQSLEILRRKRKAREVDAVAAHFGATAWLMKLWLRHGARVVFVSHGCDPSSGQHSVSVLIPLSEAAERVTRQLQAKLLAEISELLVGPLADVEGEAVKELLMALGSHHESCLQDHADVWSYGWGARSLSHCRPALRRMVLRSFQCGRTVYLQKREEQLLLDLLQGRPILSEDQLRRVVRMMLSTSLPGKGKRTR